MQTFKNRKGLALGAVFALVASLFVGTAPAQANESSVVIAPNGGTATQTTMLITEEFDLGFRFGTGVNDSLRNPLLATAVDFGVIITKPANVTVSRAVSYSPTGTVAAANFTGTDITGTEIVYTFDSSKSPVLSLSVSDKTSVSTAVSMTVQGFLDLNNNGAFDNGEPLGNSIVLNFVPWSAMSTTFSIQNGQEGDTGITASFAVSNAALNWDQLDGRFAIGFKSTADALAVTGTSATFSAMATSATYGMMTGSELEDAEYSVSEVVMAAAPFSASPRASFSGQVFYFASAQSSTSGVINVSSDALKARALTGEVVKTVQASTINNVTLSPVVSANIARGSTATAATARTNTVFTLNAYAHSTSQTASIAVARTFTVSAVAANIEFGPEAGVSVNGVSYTQSARLLGAVITLAAGTNTVQVGTFGQDNDGSSETITFIVKSQLKSATLTVTLATPVLTPVITQTVVNSATGVSRDFAVSVEDQWGAAPARTDLRISGMVDLGGTLSSTVSAAVVAGKATVNLTPSPATATGSAVVRLTLEQFNQDTQRWDAGNKVTATWNVYSYAAGTDAFVSRTASISASISYGIQLSYSAAVVAVEIANSFSDIVVSAPGLIIQNAGLTSQTASDTLTVQPNGKTASFKFTGRLAGTYTVTFTSGTATTTSQVIVNPARDADGATITFDTTAIAAGSTKVITGTLVDANGNPVNTSGSATILVTYTVAGNAGIPIGTMPTETDADGEFSITVLTGANDRGTAVVSATYYKNGASTAVADILTFNQSIVVGGAATAPAADQKLTVGSFKGFVAIYALNYTGQKLSAKVAGKWLVVEDLIRFQRVVRNTGAGYTIKVDLYIDGAFVRSETVVTK